MPAAEDEAGPRVNELGQPVGFPVDGWTSPPVPPPMVMTGQFCRVEPLDPDRHAAELFEANALDHTGRDWTYLPYGPFATFEEYRAWMLALPAFPGNPSFYAIVEASAGKALGVASYSRVDPQSGSIEVAHIHYSEPLKRTPAATEAMYLMMRNVFELGYRRYEWKCDALNEASRAAAQRLGFSYEGTFRQALVYKGRNRDTAWFSVIDSEWPELRAAFERWLDPSSFGEGGRQRIKLSDLTFPLLRRLGVDF